MNIRTTIRRQVADDLQAMLQLNEPEIIVQPSRPTGQIAAEDLPFAAVYFSEGGPDESLEDTETAQLSVTIYVSERQDADAVLDDYSDKVARAFPEHYKPAQEVEEWSYTGFAYGEDEQGTGLASLTVNFNLTWERS
ncbi:phage tail terminator protein [Oceanimonas smirnovii]|uniref:phage tail terminator protein n=1 Tax=Oceanimonas smirnovii TaxID=264574 RepID=UPI000376DBFD|nr:phage tail terminator protein [Oceanimonas smirnovii]